MTGEPDGVIGPATLEAVKTYQRSKGLGVDGFPSLTLLKALQSEAPPANVEAQPTASEAQPANAEGQPANVGQGDAGGLAPPPEGTTSGPEKVN
jgi:peptidoglycan hydrolase-like protein with peptidoglycan-binding domain